MLIEIHITGFRADVLTLFIVEKSLSQFTLDTGTTRAMAAKRLSNGYISPHSSHSLARSLSMSAWLLS
jgi:hypothetical protein